MPHSWQHSRSCWTRLWAIWYGRPLKGPFQPKIFYVEQSRGLCLILSPGGIKESDVFSPQAVARGELRQRLLARRTCWTTEKYFFISCCFFGIFYPGHYHLKAELCQFLSHVALATSETVLLSIILSLKDSDFLMFLGTKVPNHAVFH